MPDLRSDLIRLAHANPDLREHILPILAATEKEAAPETSEQAYARLLRDVQGLLHKFDAHLRDHMRKHKQDPRNYGYAGDLGYYKEKLEQMLGIGE